MSADEHDGHSRSEDLRSYATGFGLAVVLTVLAFAAAITQVFDTYGTYGCIVALGFVPSPAAGDPNRHSSDILILLLLSFRSIGRAC